MPRTAPPSLAAAALAAVLCGTGCAAFSDIGEAPAQPVPVAPVDDAGIVANARTRFVWEPVDGALWYDFHIFDVTTGDIARYWIDEVRAEDVCGVRACSIEMSVSLPRVKDHAWRVRAINRAGVSSWSRTRFAMTDIPRGGGSPGLGPTR